MYDFHHNIKWVLVKWTGQFFRGHTNIAQGFPRQRASCLTLGIIKQCGLPGKSGRVFYSLVSQAGEGCDEPGGAEDGDGAGGLAPHVEEKGERGPQQPHFLAITS